jgi:hypothetical protein
MALGQEGCWIGRDHPQADRRDPANRLRVLKQHPDGLQARVIQEVERRLPPTPFEQSDYPHAPGVRRLDKIVRFATIAPVKAGWSRARASGS